MRKKIKLSVGPGIEVEKIESRDSRWVLSVRAAGERSCPVCGKPSTSRHLDISASLASLASAGQLNDIRAKA
jgi:hypothetical protein